MYIGKTHVFFPLHNFERHSWQCNNKNKIGWKKRNKKYQNRTYNKPNMAVREKLKSYIIMQGE